MTGGRKGENPAVSIAATLERTKNIATAITLSPKAKRRLLLALLLFAAVAAALLSAFVFLPAAKYRQAARMLAEYEPDLAMQELSQIYNYKDAAVLYSNAATEIGDAFLDLGRPIDAAIWFTKAGRSLEAEQIFDFNSVVTGASYVTAAIGQDGKTYYLSNREDDDRRSGAETVATYSRFLPHSPGVNGLDKFGFVRLHDLGSYGLYLPDRQMEKLRTCTGVKDMIGVVGNGVGPDYTVLLFNDGTVSVLGEEQAPLYGLTGWKNIVSVTEGYRKIFGIDRAGRLHIAYERDYPQDQRYDISDWGGIQKVVETGKALVALQRDGCVTVAYAGTDARYRGALTYQKNITDIATNSSLLLLLRANGSVKAFRVPNWASDADSGADRYLDRISAAVNSWNGVVRIRFAAKGIYGIRFNGSVRYVSCDVSYNSVKRKYVYDGHADFAAAVSGWSNMVDVISCGTHAIGVCEDGTLRAIGDGTYLERRDSLSGATDYLRKSNGEYLNVAGWDLW